MDGEVGGWDLPFGVPGVGEDGWKRHRLCQPETERNDFLHQFTKRLSRFYIDI
jgi:hypothetical protein